MTSITRVAAAALGLTLATTSLAASAQAHETTAHEVIAHQTTAHQAPHYPVAGATVPDKDSFYRAPRHLRKLRPGHVVRIRPATATNYGSGVRAWQVAYRTNDTKRKPELAVTTLIVPAKRWTGKGARPIVSLQEPEDSTGTQCAPSYAIASGNDIAGSLLTYPFLRAGYAVAVPDHEGPQSEFLAGRQEGRAVLDGIRAVNRLGSRHGLGAGRHPWGLTGYSGGANATAWAAQLMPTYAPSLRVVGATIGGTPSDPAAVAAYLDGGPSAGFEFGVAYAISLAYPESKVGSILNAQGKADFAWLKGRCSGDILKHFAGRKLSEDTVVADPLHVPSVLAALRDDTMGRAAPSIPIFDYHAETDEIVPVGQDDALVQAWCHRGATVDVLRDPTGEHAQEAIARAGTAATYLEDRFAGKKAPTTC